MLTLEWMPMTDRPAATTTVPALADDPALAEIVRRVIETCRPLRVDLFGPRARATPAADSECDLMVVVPDDTRASLRRSARAYDARGHPRLAHSRLRRPP